MGFYDCQHNQHLMLATLLRCGVSDYVRIASSNIVGCCIFKLATPVNFESGEEVPGEMTLSSILNMDCSNIIKYIKKKKKIIV